MQWVFVSLILVLLHCTFMLVHCVRFPSQNHVFPSSSQSGFIRKEMLDLEGKYWLVWSVDWNELAITFNITVETTGWVGFGLSNNGKMSGADVIIGGMHNDGRTYFSDRHAVNTQVPVVDASQDWVLLDCKESGTHTYLSVKRKLDTCDPHDYPITENRVSLIWAYGTEDNRIRYHGQINRGNYNVYLLDPNYAPTIVRDVKTKNPYIRGSRNLDIPRDLKTWTIQSKIAMPKNSTSYLCSVHKAPRLSRKHHVIGYDVQFSEGVKQQSVHHFTIYRCHVPKVSPYGTTSNSLFGSLVGLEPEACIHFPNHRPYPYPTQWCTEVYIFWSFGGRPFFNPEHVGLPLGNDLGNEEFFLLQPHYSNPQQEDNILVELRIDLFYTSKLRPNDGGLMAINHQFPGQPESFLLPSNSSSHRVFGHCSTDCTKRMLGPQGKIKVYGALLHGHYSGKQQRLHHFRGGKELPSIAYDDNWTNDYQPSRNLRREIEVLAGDQITIDCVYDTTWANGSCVVGGYAITQDMCVGFMMYYNKIWDSHVCGSQIVSEENRRRFLNGVANVTLSEDNLDWIVSDPPKWKGLTVTEVADNFVEWDEEKRTELQRFHLYTPHVGACFTEAYARNIPVMSFTQGMTEYDFTGPVDYPFQAIPYHSSEPQCGHQ